MMIRRQTLPLALCLLLLSGLFRAAAQTADAPKLGGQGILSQPSGQTPPHVLDGTAMQVGHYDPSKMLRLALALTPPHPQEEAAFLEDVQNKKSPNFHRFLSPEEWNERFGPSVADEKAVVEWAQREGLKVSRRSKSRLVVDIESPAGDIEKAFHVTINSYREVEADGTLSEARFSNDRDPLLPSPINEIVGGVLGLNSFEFNTPSATHGKRVPGPDYVAGPAVAEGDSIRVDAIQGSAVVRHLQLEAKGIPGTGGTPVIEQNLGFSYQPYDMFSAGAYDLKALQAQGHCCNPLGNAGQSPKETTIAIAAFGDASFTDIQAFWSEFSYLAGNVQKFYIDGAPVCNNSSTTYNGNGLGGNPNCFEATMDTQWSSTIGNSLGNATNTAKIVLYEGGTAGTNVPLDLFTQILDDNSTRVVSTSWQCAEISGCSKSAMKAEDGVFASLVGQGWTIVADASDQGSTADCSTLSVAFRASDPNVVGAGGTLLSLNLNTEGFLSEVAWTGGTTKPVGKTPGSCGSNNGGGGGGFSAYFGASTDFPNIPPYQNGMGFKTRSVPDISLNAASGQFVYFNGAWIGAGGTSIVAPELAGFFAQENGYLLSLGNICGENSTSPCAPLGNANYPIYAQGKNPKSGAHVPFYDITSGCTSNDVTALNKLTAWCAKTGFDQATGWGSANMLQLAWALNWEILPTVGAPTVTFSGPAINKYTAANQNITFTIHDIANDNTKPSGIAGYTVGWDSIPTDSSSEAGGAAAGANDSFYNGPLFPKATTGCIGTAPGVSCYSSVTSGCHTAHLRAWNNIGFSSGDLTYGPVCFDNTPPASSYSVSGTTNTSGWYTSKATVTVTASDANSGLAAIYYSLDNTSCTPSNIGVCQVYKTPLVLSNQGHTYVNTFAKDNVGNASQVQYQVISIDTVPPVSTLTVNGTPYNSGYQGPVTLTLTATDATSGVLVRYIGIDSKTVGAYLNPVTVTTPGTHTIYYYSTDVAENHEVERSVSFTIAPISTTTLSVTPNPAPSTSPVTMTANVSTTSGSTPAGTVNFVSDGVTVGSAQLNPAGNASVALTLAAGSHSVIASYAGVASLAPSTSVAVPVLIYRPTTTTVSTAANTGVVGGTVTITASVLDTADAATVPTGIIMFFDTVNGVTTQLNTVPLNNGSASMVLNESYAGANVITASYMASVNTFGVSSDTTGKTITVAAANPPQAPNVNDQTIERNVASTLTIIFSYPGKVAPSGAVTISVNGVTVAGTPACIYKASGTTAHANCSLGFTTSLAAGTYPLTFTVAPDSNYGEFGGTSTLTVLP